LAFILKVSGLKGGALSGLLHSIDEAVSRMLQRPARRRGIVPVTRPVLTHLRVGDVDSARVVVNGDAAPNGSATNVKKPRVPNDSCICLAAPCALVLSPS